MSTKTATLSLEMPGKGEYTNSWHTPLNNNFQKIDDWADDVNSEISFARGSQASLAERLDVGIEQSGALKPTEEVQEARSSFLYGNRVDSVINDKIGIVNLQRDKEIWKARQTGSSLLEGIAFSESYKPSKILDGSKDLDGAPSWASGSGVIAKANGEAKPIVMSIEGKAARIRTDKPCTVSSTDGKYYVYATYKEDGNVIVTGTAGSAGTTEGALQIPENIFVFRDTTVFFDEEGVKVGDVLTLSGVEGLAGDYLIEQITYPAIELTDEDDVKIEKRHTLKIVGQFPQTGTSAYTISDPLDVDLGYVADEEDLPDNSMVIMEATVAAGALSPSGKVVARHFGDTYVGPWKTVTAVLGETVDFTHEWEHNLGSDALEVTVQVKATGSSWIETVANTAVSAPSSLTSTGLSLSGSSDSAGTGNTGPGGTDSHVHTGPSHTHGVTSVSVDGDISDYTEPYINNSLKCRYNSNTVQVANPVSGKFFTDFNGAAQTSGSVRVIVTKRG